MMRNTLFLVLISLVPAALATVSCGTDEEPESVATVDISILSVEAPEPVLPGSPLVITARGVSTTEAASGRQLEVRVLDGDASVRLAQLDEAPDGSLAFGMTSTAVTALGTGAQQVELVLIDARGQSEPFVTTLTVARELAVELTSAPGGTVFRNDDVVLSGSGFLAAGEGEVIATLVGEFTPEGEAARAVLATLPVRQAESNDRQRGLVRLSTAIGGIRPGTFEGTISLESTVGSGEPTRSGQLPLTLTFEPPALFTYTPTDPFLGQIVSIQGGGFLGDDGSPGSNDEATLLRFSGEIVLPDETTTPFEAREAVVSFVDGKQVQLGIDVEAREDRLVSGFFGIERGTFRGTVAPVVLKGTEDYVGEAIPIEVEIRGARQVVEVRFLPSFFDSLRHFGLAAGADEVVAASLERMRGIYADYNVSIDTTVPADVLPSAVAVMEIGGPDPNGLGLFGYDNTPGKDIGNLRLFDSIGGANAETQADNYPGYGGVFIESFLYWSSHPELAQQGSGSQADPLFDEIFDPVRADAATLEEVRNPDSSPRGPAVQRAVAALGAIIGETSAHELGHSLGLAQPFGSATAFHTAVPGDGCLMDSGGERPLGERIGESGYTPTRFCENEAEYLESILPLP